MKVKQDNFCPQKGQRPFNSTMCGVLYNYWFGLFVLEKGLPLPTTEILIERCH